MNTYTNVFGGQNINPADLSYKAYSLVANDIHLRWPFEALDGSNVVADKIDVDAADAIHSLWLPDATLVSVGEDILFNNVGAFQVTIRDHDGNTILTIQPGKQWYVYLIDNDSDSPGPAGAWRTTQFGAGTSAADAAALAGFGLRANVSNLDQNLLTNSVASDRTMGPSDRAQVFRSTTGVAVHTFPLSSTLGPPPADSNGWFVIEINAGTGNLSLTPTAPELIDGAATKVLSPGESCVVYCFGSGFVTMGYGRSTSTSTAAISINILGPPPPNPFILSAVQVAAQVQNFTGLLTANRIVQYGPSAGYWFIWNHTTGAFTTTFRATAIDPGVVVPQTNFSILRSDGTTMSIAFTASGGTITSIATVAGEITGGTPTPITSSGTIGLADMPAPFVPGTYGAANTVPVIEVDAKGRIKKGTNTPIAISGSQVTDLDAGLLVLIPTGMCVPFAAMTGGAAIQPNPAHWLRCSGQLVNKITYARLFTAIGTLYGAATATDFRVPDLDGRVIAGLDNGKLRITAPQVDNGNTPGGQGGFQTHKLAALEGPYHTHTVNDSGHVHSITDTGHSHGLPDPLEKAVRSNTGGGGNPSTPMYFDVNIASRHTDVNSTSISIDNHKTGIDLGSSGNGDAHNNVQPTLVMRYYIKT